MASQIKSLPSDVVHLIAAGEVIDSLAAVVRELVENAIDAGATRITVSVWPQQGRVRVTDNGAGMRPEDLEQAAIPHATSKIHDRLDLQSVQTLGFRGEALHSIARLSQLEICSRPADAAEGWRSVYSPTGSLQSTEPLAIAPGTVVTVNQLFADWPSRQKLVASARHLRIVQSTIQALAFCHPHITWQVEQTDRPWFSIWAGQTARAILPQVLRELHPDDLRELSLNLDPAQPIAPVDAESFPSAKLYVLLGLPDRCHRNRPDWVRVAINGRMVRFPELEQTILHSFRRTLPRDRFPICFVHLQLPPAEVDWNRHPAKSELYLHHLETAREQVQQAIAQILQLQLYSTTDSSHRQRLQHWIKASEPRGIYGQKDPIQPDTEPIESANPSTPAPIPNPIAPPLSSSLPHSPTDPPSAAPPTHSPTPPIAHPLPSPTQLPSAAPSVALLLLKAIAQVHDRYIVVEHPDGMWLVEQHIAHERVIFEQLQQRWQLVPLAQPITLALNTSQVEQLQAIGLEVEAFGDRLWAVRTIPKPLLHRDDAVAALQELSRGTNLEAALVATACRTAIRNGTPLTRSQMQTLIDQWQHTNHPQTCPHGRPIYLALEESSLARFFRRHWVIGKSHGI